MSKTILEMNHVTKRFPGVIALNDISITLNEGEILAICGENGAGKSTLMKVLSGSYTSREMCIRDRYSGLPKKPAICCTATATYESTLFKAVPA